MAAHLLAENVGNLERRRVQLQRLGKGLAPAYVAEIGQVLPLGERLLQFEGALPALLDALGALGLGFEDGGEFGDFLLQRFQGRGEFRPLLQLLVGETPGIDTHRQAQVARRLFHGLGAALDIEAVAGAGQALRLGVARQIDHLRRRHAVAEKQGGHFRQLVGLVEDHRVAGREQLGHTLVAQHHVGEEQVVIDHDQIGRHRLLAGLHDETFLVVRAVLAQAVVARRGHAVPDRGIFVHLKALGLVTGLRGLGEDRDATGIGGVFLGQETAVGQRALQVVGADVIGAPLEQRDLDRRLQDVAHHRQVLVEQLILQGLGAGGDDHLAVRLQRRHQVGESLARTGPRLGDEYRIVLDGGGDALGHLDLLLAHAIAANGTRQWPVGREDFGE